MDNGIGITRKVEGKEFYEANLAIALKGCNDEGYEAQFMPALIDSRINSPKDARIWQTWFCAPSIKATGKTKAGNAVVVYAHVPNYFSNYKNIIKAQKSLRNGAGSMPREEFQRLLDLEDKKNLFVVDYSALRNSTSGVISLADALKHPQTIPFLGGQARAEAYLEKHSQVFGDKIGNWHYYDDLAEQPFGRVLYVGGSRGNVLNGGYLGSNGRFVGVKKGSEGAQKNSPTPNQLQRIISEFTAPCNQEEVARRIKVLYK
jgi:hypothetical protein